MLWLCVMVDVLERVADCDNDCESVALELCVSELVSVWLAEDDCERDRVVLAVSELLAVIVTEAVELSLGEGEPLLEADGLGVLH